MYIFSVRLYITMIEVELKIQILDEESFRKKLISSGAKKLKSYFEKDEYFSPIHRDFWDTVECLRIRERTDKEKEILTYKPKTTENTHTDGIFNKKEIELELNSKKIKEIFSFLDIKPLIVVEKERTVYSLENLEITVDTLKKLGTFAEISILLDEKSSSENIKEAREKILYFLKNLDIKYKKVNLPYRHLVLERDKNEEKYKKILR